MCINRGRETKRDQEKLQKYSDPVTLNSTGTDTQVRNKKCKEKEEERPSSRQRGTPSVPYNQQWQVYNMDC